MTQKQHFRGCTWRGSPGWPCRGWTVR
ncbi:hypothetical protein CGRA01v4_00719 [Colletotrichum graminicola]|nr:hypothetical protein CGRA01v4_00719 [Colletotrichum graminicola]